MYYIFFIHSLSVDIEIASMSWLIVNSAAMNTWVHTGDKWRNNSRKNEGLEPKQKQYPVVDVTGDRSKV